MYSNKKDNALRSIGNIEFTTTTRRKILVQQTFREC